LHSCENSMVSTSTTFCIIVFTNQMQYSQVFRRTVILRINNVDKISKLIPRINLGIFSDLGITIPRLFLVFTKPDISKIKE